MPNPKLWEWPPLASSVLAMTGDLSGRRVSKGPCPLLVDFRGSGGASGSDTTIGVRAAGHSSSPRFRRGI